MKDHRKGTVQKTIFVIVYLQWLFTSNVYFKLLHPTYYCFFTEYFAETPFTQSPST